MVTKYTLNVVLALAVIQLFALLAMRTLMDERHVDALQYVTVAEEYSRTVVAVRAVESGAADVLKSYGYTDLAQLKAQEAAQREYVTRGFDKLASTGRKNALLEWGALGLILLLPVLAIAGAAWFLFKGRYMLTYTPRTA